MKNIVISVSNDLSTDQRIEKVCDTLHNHGYQITLIGRKLPNSLPIKRTYKTQRMSLVFRKGFLFYAEYNLRLFLKLLFLKKDLLLANDLDTLLPNYLISKWQRKTLVYDSHELFSEIPELVNRPKVKMIWTLLEKKLLPKVKNCYTVSHAIAKHYNKAYGTTFQVVRNIPKLQPLTTGTFPFKTDAKKTIIYQGAVNVGRGLELMIDSMQYLNNYQLVIVGTGDVDAQLKTRAAKLMAAKKVVFLGKLLPTELRKITPLATLGISLEEDLGLSYRYALPNKIFDYVHAEIPVLCSNLPEMKALVTEYGFGEVLQQRTPKALAMQIQNLPLQTYAAASRNAKKTLHWEQETEILLALYNNAK